MAAALLTRLAQGSIGLGTLTYLAQESLFTVDAGHRAVLMNRFSGLKEEVYGEGTWFRLPFIEWPHLYEVRTQPRLIETRTGTRDLQSVDIKLRVLFKPIEGELPTIHLDLGEHYAEKVLPSIGNEVLKSVVAQYNAEQLLTERETVSRKIRDDLTARAADFKLVLDDVSITHLGFGAEFSRAIEAKQVALQDAERAKFEVMKSEQERIANVIRSEAEAESAKLIADALGLAGSGLIELRKIQAAKDIATNLAATRNVTYLPGGVSPLLPLGK
eukprot:PLAT12213.1.p2 GENE.PLAT12213.1~~PLAT12213.1.p2  ORF type:complete len:284 (+),score=111.13 PLAT12213.1:34-852(+)